MDSRKRSDDKVNLIISNIEPMTETIEFINWLGDLAAEAIRTGSGGFEGNELINFSDELIGAFKGVGGFPKNARQEAEKATPQQITEAWQFQEVKIVQAGAAPMLARGIVSHLQGLHALLAYAAQQKAAKELR